MFDDWHNDMPIAWIITNGQQQEDLIDWLFALKHHTSDQKPSCFIMDDAPQDMNTTRYVKTTTYFRHMIYVIKLYIFNNYVS